MNIAVNLNCKYCLFPTQTFRNSYVSFVENGSMSEDLWLGHIKTVSINELDSCAHGAVYGKWDTKTRRGKRKLNVLSVIILDPRKFNLIKKNFAIIISKNLPYQCFIRWYRASRQFHWVSNNLKVKTVKLSPGIKDGSLHQISNFQLFVLEFLSLFLFSLLLLAVYIF